MNSKNNKLPSRRPQEPQLPLPYLEETVSIASGSILLSGTLTRPTGSERCAAVVLIAGSGPQNRDEEVLSHRPFLVLADYLTRSGLAVLRYDKRGVGSSTGCYKLATTMDFADDAQAAVAFLKTRADIDQAKIGLLGHSEGGAIAPIVASRSSDVTFVVSLAGAVLSGEEILLGQVAALSRAIGLDEGQVNKAVQRSGLIYAIIKAERDNVLAAQRIAAVLRPESQASDATAPGDETALMAQIDILTSPWFRCFLSLAPLLAWSKVHCPVLALNGEKDLQVLPGENLSALQEALTASGNNAVTIKEIAGVNHLFQTCQSGLPAEYAQIEETIAPAVLELIGTWIGELFSEHAV